MVAIQTNLGFQGAGWINGVQVLMTNGGFSAQQTAAYTEPYNIDRDGYTRSKVHHADGVSVNTGTIGFDLTASSLIDLLTINVLLKRGFTFPVEIFDGNVNLKALGCMVNSLTISGSSEGLINASMSFMYPSGTVSGSFIPAFNRNNIASPAPQAPMGYWYAGVPGLKIKSWSLMFTQNLSPVFLNNSGSIYPKYLKAGLTSFTLNMTTFSPLGGTEMPGKYVLIGASAFKVYGSTTESGYTFGGQTDVGTYSHVFESSALNVSSGSIIDDVV